MSAYQMTNNNDETKALLNLFDKTAEFIEGYQTLLLYFTFSVHVSILI